MIINIFQKYFFFSQLCFKKMTYNIVAKNAYFISCSNCTVNLGSCKRIKTRRNVNISCRGGQGKKKFGLNLATPKSEKKGRIGKSRIEKKVKCDLSKKLKITRSPIIDLTGEEKVSVLSKGVMGSYHKKFPRYLQSNIWRRKRTMMKYIVETMMGEVVKVAGKVFSFHSSQNLAGSEFQVKTKHLDARFNCAPENFVNRELDILCMSYPHSFLREKYDTECTWFMEKMNKYAGEEKIPVSIKRIDSNIVIYCTFKDMA